MAQTTVLNLLAHADFSGAVGVASTFTGEKQPAASYYISGKDLQTIIWNLASNFTGNIEIQASLVTAPTDADWFTVYTINGTTTQSGYHNLYGNFVWIRAKIVGWLGGCVETVNISY